MGNKMCFCSCLPMTSSQKEDFDIEDNQTFVYTPSSPTFKPPTEVQRTQFKRQSNTNTNTADLFTIFDHHVTDMSTSLYLNNESNRQSLTSNTSSQSPSSSSSNQLLDAGSLLETSIVVVDEEEDDSENIDAISVDSGICNSNRSSLSVICDDKHGHRQCEEIKVTCDLNLFKTIKNKTKQSKKNSIKKHRNNFRYESSSSVDQTFLHKLKENMFLRVKECISMTYLMFSTTNNNNNNSNSENTRQNISIVLNDTNNIVRPDAAAEHKRVNRLFFIGSVKPLCQFFLRIYDTNFF
jgi:hypothetical protein